MPGLSFICRDIGVRHIGTPTGDGGPAIQQLSVAIEQGEQVALIGPSGAGKTTLLETLAAALQPSSGSIVIDGTDPWQLSSRKLRALRVQLFLAPQVPPLPPRQRVATAVLAGRLPRWSLIKSIRSLLFTADAIDAYQALQAFSLGEKLWQRVDRLSGGERQRVSLARSLISEARALLVDEPLSALDPALAGQTLRALIDHAQTHNKTLICSLHQVEMALDNFPRVIGLREGELVFDLPADEITADAIHDLYFGYEDQVSESMTESMTEPLTHDKPGKPGNKGLQPARCI